MIDRVLGCYDGAVHGPLLVVFGAVHGNENAGVRALQEVFRLLEKEPEHNPDFCFTGRLLGLLGNVQAYRQQARFVKRDLNRMWTSQQRQLVEHSSVESLDAEDREMHEIIQLIHQQLIEYRPEALVLLDLHTTSAQGGIFCIPTDDMASLRLAKALHAPVVLGMLEGIEGTLLHYTADNLFELGGFPKYAMGVAFESGQHEDPLSVDRAIAVIVHLLRAAGCIREEEVDTRHEAVLRAYSKELPKVTRLLYVHHLRPGDGFRMHPGFVNFQRVEAGQHIADDITGPVLAPHTGMLLMPLYQMQGSDGFFLVEPIE